MSTINGYYLDEKLSTKNAGFCQWGFCKKNGHEFFIKEFLEPKYPENTTDLSPKTIERRLRLCQDFYAEKNELYDALMRCRTGNIVVVTDFFRAGSRYYVVTDKVNSVGTDPSTIASLSNYRKEVLLRSILFSVARFHSEGIVHADIKPSNMLLKPTQDGFYTVKIIDFDASFFTGEAPEDVQGDFIYLAPEMFLKMNDSSIQLDQKIDIFALGILFHQYWTGELPKIQSDYHYVFEAVLDESEVQLSSSLPPHVRKMIRRMLTCNPLNRPGAEELLRDFCAKTDSSSPPEKSDEGRRTEFYIPGSL